MRHATIFAAVVGCVITLSCAADESALKTSPLGQAFGAPPLMRGLKLSPDGNRIVFLQTLPAGVNVARLVDFTKPQPPTVVLSGRPNEFDVNWCDWANDTRLLCGIGGTGKGENVGVPVQFTRLVGVNADGSDMKVLLERSPNGFTQFQDRVVDWLPDDADHVLVQMPSQRGSGVGILDIKTGQLRVRTPVLDGVFTWISDGHGAPRLYQQISREHGPGTFGKRPTRRSGSRCTRRSSPISRMDSRRSASATIATSCCTSTRTRAAPRSTRSTSNTTGRSVSFTRIPPTTSQTRSVSVSSSASLRWHIPTLEPICTSSTRASSSSKKR